MLKPPDHQPYRIIACDPGTDTLGLAFLEVDLGTQSTAIAQVHTFRGSQLQRLFPTITAVHGDRMARLIAHEENIFQFLHYARPHAVITEGPYMGRFPAAFAALVECVSAIRRAVIRYDHFMPLHVIDPSTVKKSMGVKGTSGDKDAMRRALTQALDDPAQPLTNPSNIEISSIDEHGVDAICVGWLLAKQVLTALETPS